LIYPQSMQSTAKTCENSFSSCSYHHALRHPVILVCAGGHGTDLNETLGLFAP
jgi:hypothetical protein